REKTLKSPAAPAAAFVALLTSAAFAFAGPVTFTGVANALVTYHDSVTNNDDSQILPFNGLPGADTLSYHGTPDPAFPEFGSNRGDSGVTYDLKDLPDGASFNLKVF